MASPSKLSEPAKTYLKFLKQAQAARASTEAAGLGPNEDALLSALALHWASGRPLAVREAMLLSDLGSPSTLHRRIGTLKQLGLIEDQSQPGNLRVKLLTPTKKALGQFNKLGTLVLKAAK